MADRDVLPDNVKPLHYILSLRDLDFDKWSYRGTVTYVHDSRSYPSHLDHCDPGRLLLRLPLLTTDPTAYICRS